MKHIALAVTLLLAGGPGLAMAQETTGAISGYVITPEGDTASDLQVTIIHNPSGTVSNTETNSEGRFRASGLRVGGPYTVTINEQGTYKVEDVYVRLGQTSDISLVLGDPRQTAIEELIVTGDDVSDLAEEEQTSTAVSRILDAQR